MTRKRILFYSSVNNIHLFDIQRFYTVDIKLLESIGYDVIKTNKVSCFFKFWKYDISFLYFYRWSLFPALISKFFSKNIYFTGGIDHLEEKITTRREYLIQVWLFKLCYLLSKTCIIVSNSDLENIKKIFNKKQLHKIYLSFHTINVENYYLEDLSGKNNHFSTIAWMESVDNIKRKGIDKALIIFHKLINNIEFSDSKFYIIGKQGKGSDYLKKLCKSLEISNKVVFTGSISEEQKISVLKKNKYYFQLSTFEGFGIAAIEALAAKNIVIHSGNGGLNETIRDFGVMINIETNFDEYIENVLHLLVNYNYDLMFKSTQHITDNYSNRTRQNDFKIIIRD
jgi:glycosyltransferase involved in cell wall biosynthesis